MNSALHISARLLKGGGRRDSQSVILAIVAYALTTALLLVILGGLHGFHQRSERASAWTVEGVSSSAGSGRAAESGDAGSRGAGSRGAGSRDDQAEIAAHREPAGGKSMTVIDVAGAKDGSAKPGDVPPGLSTMPGPGQIYVSPALAAMIEKLPDSQLSDRFARLAKSPAGGASIVGRLPADSMPTPGSLIAVVGHAHGDAAVRPHGHDNSWDVLAPRYYKSFAAPSASLTAGVGDGTASLGVDDSAPTYLGLAWLAVVLMLVPLVTLGGAAARLGVSRRNARLAALRLAGATPGQVVGMTAAESMVHAACGALIGAVLSVVLLPVVRLVRFQGAGFSFSELWIGALPMLGVIAGVIALAGISAVIGLRRVVVSPLGVAAKTTPPGITWVRAAAFVAVVIGWNVFARSAAQIGISVVLVALVAVFAVVNLIGPWLVYLMAKIRARRAVGAVSLLAARRLLDDPKAAWRGVSGLALAGFVAAIVSVMPALTGVAGTPPPTVSVTASAGAHQASDGPGETSETRGAAGLESAVKKRLADAHIDAAVTTSGSRVDATPRDRTPAAEDAAVTALSGLSPGTPVTSSTSGTAADADLMPDIRTGVLFTLLITFVIAASSVGIAQAASTLDRRQLYGLMRLAGTDRSTLNAVRFRTTLWPLLLTVVVSAGLGLFFTLPMLGAVVAQPSGLLMLVGCLVAGVALVLAASAASRPILTEVLRDPSPRPD